MFKRFFPVLIVLVFFGCTTKDGILIGPEGDRGSVLVRINNSCEQGNIFVNYKNTGKITPEIINLVPGRHVVHVYIPGYQAKEDSMIVFIEAEKLIEITFEMEAVNSGRLTINSHPEYAMVLLNGIRYGITPLVLEGMPVGNYRLDLKKSGYKHSQQQITIGNNQQTEVNSELISGKRPVVLEHFSNIDCPGCPDADEVVESVIQQLDTLEIISIGYHPKFPSPNDPFYLAASQDNQERIDQYEVTEIPKIFLEGEYIEYYSNYPYLESQLKTDIPERANIDFQYADFDIWAENSYENISGNIRINVKNELPADTKLRIVLIEKEIHFPEAPGSNQAKDFYDIMRKIHPNANGIAINLESGQNQTFPFSFLLQPNWIGGLQVVAFLQTGNSGEIFHAVRSMIY